MLSPHKAGDFDDRIQYPRPSPCETATASVRLQLSEFAQLSLQLLLDDPVVGHLHFLEPRGEVLLVWGVKDAVNDSFGEIAVARHSLDPGLVLGRLAGLLHHGPGDPRHGMTRNEPWHRHHLLLCFRTLFREALDYWIQSVCVQEALSRNHRFTNT